MSVRVFAPAKINPWLEVLGRRPDGYHELETTMVALDLCDVVEARASDVPGVQLDVDGPFASADVPRDARNHAFAAADFVLRAASRGVRARGLALRLTKNVPSQAGLGGGSSDAAAAMLAAERALAIELDEGAARAELERIGSDCVFFRAAAATGHALCRGRGERVEALPALARRWVFALVTPSVGAPTGAVYDALADALRKTAPASTVPAVVFERSLRTARAELFNRLEDAALALLPELRRWRQALDLAGASHFRLCGSGSSFFGVHEDRAAAQAELARIAAVAREHGLAPRGAWIAAPLGAGARVAHYE